MRLIFNVLLCHVPNSGVTDLRMGDNIILIFHHLSRRGGFIPIPPPSLEIRIVLKYHLVIL
jgi:hypothetical protein